MSKLIFSSILMFLFFTGFSHASERLASFYLDSEVILNSGARSLGVKVVDVRAVKSKDFKSFYFVQYKMSTPNNGMVYPMFAMNKPSNMLTKVSSNTFKQKLELLVRK